MREVAAAFPDDADVQVLRADALMNLQPWDYWEADGATPKGNAAEIVAHARAVAGASNPEHPGASTSTSTPSRPRHAGAGRARRRPAARR